MFHTQLYRNSKKQYHAGLPEAKFGAKKFRNMRNKVFSVASTNNNLKGVTSVQGSAYFLKFQIDKYEGDDNDTANEANHFQTCYCKCVEIM